MMPAHDITEEFKRYAYSVSHDVSAPVRAMVEFSRLLSAEEAGALSADSKEYLALIVENGRKLQAMMDGLLQYSRLNTQAKPFEKVDLNVIARTALAELRGRIEQAHATIEVPDLPVVQADPEQMRQLFYALIDNAIKFQPEGGVPHVHLSMRKKKGSWELSVADNGIGIESRFHESIFHLFKRLHTDEEYSGVGVGLTLAKKIAEQHGGAISCVTDTSSGAVFMVSLPM